MFEGIKRFFQRGEVAAREYCSFGEGPKVKLTGVPIQIFRAGDYGSKGRYSVQDLQAMAAAFADRAGSVIPKITLHHKDDASIGGEPGPFGVVERLEVAGDKLMAVFGSVSAKLQEWVDAHPYAERSAEIYPAGKLDARPVLRGVSFVTVPEVKGMEPLAAFADEHGEYCAYFGEDMQQKQQEESEEDTRMAEENKTTEQAGADHSGALAQELSEAKAKIAEFAERETAREKRLEQLEHSERRAKITAALAGAAGIPPATKNYPGLVEFCEGLAQEGALNFGEGEQAKSEDRVSYFIGFMEHAAKTGVVPTAPTGAADVLPNADGGKPGNLAKGDQIAQKFNDPEFVAANPNPVDRINKATLAVAGR